MISDAPSMVVTRRSSRFRAFRAAAPFFAKSAHLHGFAHACSNVLLAVGVLGGMAVVAALLLSGARPSWWREGASSTTTEARRALAGAVDNGAWTVVTRVRPMRADVTSAEGRAASEPWSVSLSAAGATAWLNEKLPLWLEAQEHPVQLPMGAEMQAAFEPGVVRFGMRVPEQGGGEGGRFVALSLTPRVDDKGLWLTATTASLGRLEVPVGAVLPSKGGEGKLGVSRELAAVLRGQTPALADGAIRLPDGRKVRLLRFDVVDDRVVLTMRTEGRQIAK